MPTESYTPTRRAERRPSKRAMVLVYEGADSEETQPAITVDESDLGARIETQAQLKAGQLIELQSEDSALRLRCRVVWTGEVASDKEGEAGLEFLFPPPV